MGQATDFPAGNKSLPVNSEPWVFVERRDSYDCWRNEFERAMFNHGQRWADADFAILVKLKTFEIRSEYC